MLVVLKIDWGVLHEEIFLFDKNNNNFDTFVEKKDFFIEKLAVSVIIL